MSPQRNATRRAAGLLLGQVMIKFSLVVLFVMSLATLTVAASALPVPPATADVQVAALG